MKKILQCILIILAAISLFGCTNDGTKIKESPQETEEGNKKAVVSLVKDFGQKLQMISLQAPKDIISESMEKLYGDLVSPELLAKWQNDPQNAPGRVVSSPWPDRIEISAVEKLLENSYEVKGEIIEITSEEKAKGGFAGKRPVTMMVKRFENRWLIDEVALGAYEEISSVVYKNTQYGFNFSLPKSWEGYTIETDQWKGLAIGDSQGEKVIETGPIIGIRHPEWTAKNPRQDIPIMIFTLAQWDSLQQEKFHIGAAPMGPKELGRNPRYVFALPARYNYAFLTGYEEVETILRGKPLQPTKSYD